MQRFSTFFLQKNVFRQLGGCTRDAQPPNRRLRALRGKHLSYRAHSTRTSVYGKKNESFKRISDIAATNKSTNAWYFMKEKRAKSSTSTCDFQKQSQSRQAYEDNALTFDMSTFERRGCRLLRGGERNLCSGNDSFDGDDERPRADPLPGE